ncbi:MAG: hypothetical protein IH943_08630 [Acidobacteria bacterium]|nr:hypothetical protein [Acidobacteriota bacterium]
MTVAVGTVCPGGMLPVYSCDTEAEARRLIVICCPMDYDGRYYARELIDPNTSEPYEGDERIDAFVRFGLKLEETHERTSRA